MWHGECEMLDVVSYSRQCFEVRGASESTWGESQAGSGEKRSSYELTAL
jgi:hypothetical protein